MNIFTIVILLTCCTLELMASSNPISPSDYQKVIGQGFSTNYFKTLDFSKYSKTNIEHVAAKGFKNLRLRCRADLDGLDMTKFLKNLKTVVNDSLNLNVTPIISWIHHEAEANATDEARTEYLNWWTKVATKLRSFDYRLSFNLFTELGIDGCGNDCSNSLRENTDKYNDWTKRVVNKIRNAGGKSDKRIIILGSPKKTAKDLNVIDENIYKDDDYMMAEWHIYASGPNKDVKNGKKSQKYWTGNGTDVGQTNVNQAITYATNFTKNHKLKTYLGAWMPWDNKGGALNQTEVTNFGKFFASRLKQEGIPWTMNVLDAFYDTSSSSWLTGTKDVKGASLNLIDVLDEMKTVM